MKYLPATEHKCDLDSKCGSSVTVLFLIIWIYLKTDPSKILLLRYAVWPLKWMEEIQSALILVIFSLTSVRILRSMSEQLVSSRAVTMLRYTRCNIVILMAATAWLMLYFSSCIVCGFDSYTVLTLEKYGVRIKSAHDTATEVQHKPRSCSHQNHYVTSGIPQHD